MILFEPRVGLVIRYAYLWRREARAGRDESSKDRPCVITYVRENEHRETEVYVAPITHASPPGGQRTLLIPQETKARLRLDAQSSWIITNDINCCIWPGADHRPVPGGGSTYGFLPHGLANDVLAQIRAHERERTLGIVNRDDQETLELLRSIRQRDRPKDRDRDRER